MSDTETVNGLVEEVTTYVVQLQAENAKLRDELDAAKHDLSLFSGRIVELGAENAKLQASNEVIAEDHAALCEHNAKLRELVRFIMHQCNDGNPRCDECIGWNDGECMALLRMRELGIEVDG